MTSDENEYEPKKWRRFEKLAAHIQRTLAPHAHVEHDVVVLGKSGAERQIDIAIRMNVGQLELFIAVECKDHRHPVDIKDVEMFIGQVGDVGAHKGAMVVSHGYTPAALTRAKQAGIDMYTLVDAESKEWPKLVGLPAVCEERSLFVALGLSSAELRHLPVDLLDLLLFDENGNRLGTVMHIIGRLWNEQRMPIEVGEYDPTLLLDGHTFVLCNDRPAHVRVHISVKIENVLKFGLVPLAKIQGFRDENTGMLHTRNFITDKILLNTLGSEWGTLPSEDALAVPPVLWFMMTSCRPDGFTEHGVEPPPWPVGLPLPPVTSPAPPKR